MSSVESLSTCEGKGLVPTFFVFNYYSSLP